MLNRVIRSSWVSFGAIAGAVFLVSLGVASSAFFAGDPAVLGVAIAADLAVFVPLMYWWLVVHRGGAPARTLLPVVVLGILAARLVLPTGSRVGGGLLYLALPAEVGLVVWVAWKVRSILAERPFVGDRDVVDAVECALAGVLGRTALVRVLSAELAAMYYGVASWWKRKPHVPEGALAFRAVGAPTLIAVLGVVVVLETIGAHLLVSRWSAGAAWCLTGLSAYTLLWVVGDCRALVLRPTLVTPSELVIRVGLRCAARAPYSSIVRAERADWREGLEPVEGRLNMAAPGVPNVVITFRRPIRVRRVLGHETSALSVALRVQDPEGLLTALRVRMTGLER